MIINVTYDSSAADAPAGFEAAVQAAVQYYESIVSDPITVNITFGWGAVDGQALSAGSVGETITTSQYAFNYDQIRNALWQDATTPTDLAAAESLPATDPTGDGTFLVNSAQAKAIGLIPGSDTGTDGYIGLDSTTQFTFDPNNRSAPGLVDAIGVLEHEIGHVLGRSSYLGDTQPDGTTLYSPLDLFRYTAPGVLSPTSVNSSFSYNGQNLLLPFNNPLNGGDADDWSITNHGDSYDAFVDTGEEMPVSATDQSELDVMGYHPTPVTPSMPTPSVLPSPTFNMTAPYQLAQGQTYYVTDSSSSWSSVWAFTYITSDTTSPAPFTNDGTIICVSTVDGGVVADVEGGGNWDGYSFDNTATGAIYASATGSDAEAFGFQGLNYSPDLDNAGLIQVEAPNGSATGAYQTGHGFTNEADGIVTVVGGSSGIGVDFNNSNNSNTFTNSGTIDVVAQNAIGVRGAGAFTNSGTISATDIDGGTGSIAVALYNPSLPGFSQDGPYDNSGTIEGNYAFYSNLPYAFSPNLSITNSGTVIGTSYFSDSNTTVVNTGIIGGDLIFGDSSNTYSGSGTLYGAIWLAIGNDTITLGKADGIVHLGGGSGTVTGGAGNDFFDVTRGSYTIDGGGGTNTLSFASADMGVTLDLGAGTASVGGTDQVKNIQVVVGSSYDDTLVAGNSAVTFIAGDGQDTLRGGAGNDTLVAGTGGDTMTGGGGNNIFAYSSGDGRLVVTDFDANGDKDVLNIYGYASATSVQQQGANTLITLSGGDSVLLQNVQASSLANSSVVYSSTDYATPLDPVSQSPFGTSTIFVDQNLQIYAGETLDETQQSAGLVGRGYSLDNFGTVGVDYATSSDTDYGWVDSNYDKNDNQIIPTFDTPVTRNVTNEAGATFDVTNSAGAATGFYALGSENAPSVFLNAGRVSILGAGEVEGLSTDISSYLITNASTGSFNVTSLDGTALGYEIGNSATIVNKGVFTVDGYTDAYWLSMFSELGSTITNSGTITVSAAQGGLACAIAITGLSEIPNTNGPQYVITNSGTITARDAIDVDDAGLEPSQRPVVSLTNSGTISGNINLWTGPNQIVNTGSINGNITYGNGDAVYTGTTGAMSGAIYLGYGTSNVVLGSDGEVVFGSPSGGSDKITGGAGNDYIEIGRGINTIDGGGGFNTLSFGDADMGVTVDLGAGTAFAAGADAIQNIQEVIGSNFSDTLKAGAQAATLVGGAGSDTLVGGAGNDTLVSGTGGGTMTGNAGNDIFVYSIGDHHLVVNDFDANANQDILKIYGYTSAISAQQQGADTLITLSNSDTILLKNVQTSSLSGSNVVYNASAYSPGQVSAAAPAVFGSSTIDYDYDLTIYAGENLAITQSVGMVDDDDSINAAVNGRLHNLDNSGSLTISDSSGDVTGINIAPYVVRNTSSTQTFTNEAGATFSVSAPAGSAVGLFGPQSSPFIYNAGTYEVSSSGAAYGEETWQGPFNNTITNTSIGVMTVSSSQASATGLYLFNGGSVENNGVIDVTGATDVYGLWLGGRLSLTNAGQIVAAGNAAGAHTYGVYVAGYVDEATITNTGTITAQTAIYCPVDDFVNITLTNSGTINGDIDLGESDQDQVTNTGTINGNILVHDGRTTIDLRGGNLSGVVSITPTASDSFVNDTIYSGSNAAVIQVHGGNSGLLATVIGNIGGQTTVQYDEASSLAAWIRNTNGSWTVSAGTDGTETLTNVQTLQFTDKTVNLPRSTPAPNDFTGSGMSDILWQNTDGQAAIWTMNGFTQVGGQPIGGDPGSNWKVVGATDFNGDGMADILWQDTDNGQVVVWTMNGFTQTSSTFIGGAPGAQWKVVATGDFAGNGQEDLVFQNAGGQAVLWTMNATSQTASTFVGGDPGSQWHIVGTGDFNGDGKSDIVWQDSDNGQVVVWTMNGTSQTGSFFVGDAPGSDWKVAGVGDFAGNGQADLLFQNTTTGQPVLWTMSGTTQSASTFIGGNPGPTWHIEGVGDYNGDGKADILWQNDNGQAAVWTMNGATQLGGSPVGGNPGTSWHIPAGVG